MRWSNWCCGSEKRHGRGETMLRRTPSGTLWRTPGLLSMTPPKARDGNLNDELAEQAMSGQKKGGDGRAAGGYSKRGKPRVGTGGFRRDRLEGKGATPPAPPPPGSPPPRAAAAAGHAAR